MCINAACQDVYYRPEMYILCLLSSFGNYIQEWCYFQVSKPSWSSKTFTFKNKIFLGECWRYIWYGPLPVTVTSRIITCLGSGISINLHFPLLEGGGHIQEIYCVYIYILIDRMHHFNMAHGQHLVKCPMSEAFKPVKLYSEPYRFKNK